MSNVMFPVTAKRRGPGKEFAVSKREVVWLFENEVSRPEPKSGGNGCSIFTGADKVKIECLESLLDFKTAQVEGSSSNPYTGGNANLTVSAAGSALGSATGLTAYLNVVTTATASSADGVSLPDPANRNICVVVNDHATVTIEVFPHNAAANIDGGAAGASVQLAPGERGHFYTDDTGNDAAWYKAIDNGI